MSEDEISIKINICDRFYPLRIKAVEEESVRRAANTINERAKYYIDNYSVQDKQDALAMVALEFASETSGESKDINQDALRQKLNELEQMLDL